MIDPEIFPAPSWLLAASAISGRDASHAELVTEKHAPWSASLASVADKLHYLQGVLDAAFLADGEDAGE